MNIIRRKPIRNSHRVKKQFNDMHQTKFNFGHANNYFHNKLNKLYPKREINSIAQIVISEIVGIEFSNVPRRTHTTLKLSELEQMVAVVENLLNGVPVQYVLGETEFFGLKFDVNPSVLIPRQETEELVQLILHKNKNINKLHILDIGTGSGCIAISLAKNFTDANVVAWDISSTALETAKTNATKNNVDLQFLEIDILLQDNAEKNEIFDLIVSNPPYVRNSEKQKMHTNVLNFEPELALFVDDNNSLVFYEAIADKAHKLLKPNGQLYFEINEALPNETKAILDNYGFRNIEVIKDINEKPRIIFCIK